jgi:hypothetical protein
LVYQLVNVLAYATRMDSIFESNHVDHESVVEAPSRAEDARTCLSSAKDFQSKEVYQPEHRQTYYGSSALSREAHLVTDSEEIMLAHFRKFTVG